MDLPRHAYFRGRIVPYSEAKVGVATHALNYGTAVFGGLRGYWNSEKERLFVFRPLDHFRRFLDSCRLLLMDIGQTPESLTAILLDLLRADGYRQDIYIRPLAYKSDEQIGVRLHNLSHEWTMFAMPFGQYIKNETSAHVMISSWRRVDDNVIPARGKISGAYVNSALVKTEASLNGYDDALVLTQDGHITEGSAMNVFIVRNGMLITPPVTENILEGITRRTVIELAQNELNIPVVERPIDRSEVYLCDEILLTGTAAQITVVTRVDHRPVGTGEMGPVAAKLRALFDKIARGNDPKYADWLLEV
ncbi:MAG: branched-chain amino acid transaminase [Anaerolineales bacterium]|nr:branched-chain amino acid transaminase [Anaerolineales bacterium]MCX7607865.1 branched-chain amino acid transaminase [Anaerolineales bacterium]MDW8226459.1 branched-chain amino acid transaminase [Anaerolineales bacterium]